MLALPSHRARWLLALVAARAWFDILRAAERAYGGALDPAYPFRPVASCDQTLPFHFKRPTTLVACR